MITARCISIHDLVNVDQKLGKGGAARTQGNKMEEKKRHVEK